MSANLPTGVPSRAHEIVVTCIVCSILSTVFVLVRTYTRCFINRSLGWDDYIAIITLPFSIAYGVLIGVSTLHGMGLHEVDMTPDLMTQYYLWISIASLFYVLSLMGYKFAILLLYLRIYGVNRTFRWTVYATMFLIFGYLFCNLWTEFFGCDPPQKTWQQQLPGHCIDGIKSDYAYGSLNCISDLIIFVLPIPMLWRTQLKLREKIGIMIIFMFGSLNWAVAIVRFVFAVQDLTAVDRTWLAARTFLLSVIEINTGLVCCCVPVLKPFYKTVVSKTLTSRSWSISRTKTGREGRASTDDQTSRASDTALTDMEVGKKTTESASTVNGSERQGSSVSAWKNHDFDDGKYGFDHADV